MNKLIPERLKNAREARSLTKAAVSRLCGLSKIGYCRYEYGDRSPSPQMIDILSQRLGTSAAYLTGETEDMRADQIVVSKDGNPALFELTEQCMGADEKTLKRLLAYYHKIKE